MIDVCYTPDLLAALADVPPSAWLNTVQCIRGRIPFSEAFVNKLKTAVHPSGVRVLEKPDGRAIISCTVEYSVNRHRVTTWLDAKGRALVKADEFLRDVETRFGLVVSKASLSHTRRVLDGRLELVVALRDGSFRVFDFGRDAEAISVDGAPHATLDVREEYKPDRIVTSFFETDRDNPWVQVVEERREEHDRN